MMEHTLCWLYQLLFIQSWSSCWWAASLLETRRGLLLKYINSKECILLVHITRIYQDARTTKQKINFFPKSPCSQGVNIWTVLPPTVKESSCMSVKCYRTNKHNHSLIIHWLSFITNLCFGCLRHPSSGRHRFTKGIKVKQLLTNSGVKLLLWNIDYCYS